MVAAKPVPLTSVDTSGEVIFGDVKRRRVADSNRFAPFLHGKSADKRRISAARVRQKGVSGGLR